MLYLSGSLAEKVSVKAANLDAAWDGDAEALLLSALCGDWLSRTLTRRNGSKLVGMRENSLPFSAMMPFCFGTFYASFFLLLFCVIHFLLSLIFQLFGFRVFVVCNVQYFDWFGLVIRTVFFFCVIEIVLVCFLSIHFTAYWMGLLTLLLILFHCH